MPPQKKHLQPHIYHPLEPCRARIGLMSGTPMVPIITNEDPRSPVIRGETTAACGAKPAARVQPMGVLQIPRANMLVPLHNRLETNDPYLLIVSLPSQLPPRSNETIVYLGRLLWKRKPNTKIDHIQFFGFFQS